MNITEINQKKLSSLDTSQLKAMHDIFKGVSNPNAKKITQDLAVELKSRKTESIEEASGKGVIKSIVSAAKKIGGVIDKVFDDKEFQDAYAKYIENPKDKKALKKAQAFASGLIDTSPVSGMGESSKLKEGRISKICSIVLGENFCPDFIYEDIDFTKPSEIKEAYEIFEASADWIIYDRKTGKQLSPSKSWRKWQGAKAAASKIGGDAEVSDKAWYHDNKAKLMGEATELEEAVSQADIKKILAAAKKAGGDIKGNQIDFGMGAVLDVSIEKGKIKLDAGKSNGVEYFKTAKDAVMAFESVDFDLEEAFSRLPGNVINNELYVVNRAIQQFTSSQKNGDDVDEKKLNQLIKALQVIKKEVKQFNNPEDVPVKYQYKSK